eukprot:m.250404 g.250404  ORF g.250404 m.250404 type:complete len:540 (-) comp16706_c0_seq1:237-1856(-)
MAHVYALASPGAPPNPLGRTEPAWHAVPGEQEGFDLLAMSSAPASRPPGSSGSAGTGSCGAPWLEAVYYGGSATCTAEPSALGNMAAIVQGSQCTEAGAWAASVYYTQGSRAPWNLSEYDLGDDPTASVWPSEGTSATFMFANPMVPLGAGSTPLAHEGLQHESVVDDAAHTPALPGKLFSDPAVATGPRAHARACTTRRGRLCLAALIVAAVIVAIAVGLAIAVGSDSKSSSSALIAGSSNLSQTGAAPDDAGQSTTSGAFSISTSALSSSPNPSTTSRALSTSTSTLSSSPNPSTTSGAFSISPSTLSSSPNTWTTSAPPTTSSSEIISPGGSSTSEIPESTAPSSGATDSTYTAGPDDSTTESTDPTGPDGSGTDETTDTTITSTLPGSDSSSTDSVPSMAMTARTTLTTTKTTTKTTVKTTTKATTKTTTRTTTKKPTTTTQQSWLYYAIQYWNRWSTPSTSGDVLGSLAAGAAARVLCCTGGTWVCVPDPLSGQNFCETTWCRLTVGGYVPAANLALPRPAPTPYYYYGYMPRC